MSHHRDPATALRMRLRELAMARPRYGYRRLWLLLRREGWRVNHKRVLRLYREEGLLVRTRRRRKITCQARHPFPRPDRINERWAMDFMMDELKDGRRIRIFNVIDCYSREALTTHADHSLPAAKVTAALDRMIFERGLPNSITCDNGTEFTSRHFDAWAYEHRITLDFIRPGRPVGNGTIESFNGRLRDECLSQHWFESLAEAQDILQAWRTDYNEVRPHSSLENRTPKEVAERVLSWATG